MTQRLMLMGDSMIDLSIEISSLEERIKFAWEDDEYENEI